MVGYDSQTAASLAEASFLQSTDPSSTSTACSSPLLPLPSSLIGHLHPFSSPLGSSSSSSSFSSSSTTSPKTVPLVYADFTASSRPLKSIESFLRKNVLKFYGNTHTTTSVTGGQSTAFRGEARQAVAEGCGAHITGKAARDVVLFVGNGATGAVNALIDILNVKEIATMAKFNNMPNARPLVFVGPMEHHSNLIPWRESGAEVISIPPTSTGALDMLILEKLLLKHKNRAMKIGTFTACSNVTGRINPIDTITKLLHVNGALAFWDYATGAPYIDIEMNRNDTLDSKDAVFISPHKMVGGTASPGVLVVKKALISQNNPVTSGGGGTVFYVTDEAHRFLSSRVERYEGGTPNVIGCMRAGLAFIAKRQYGGGKVIKEHEFKTRETAMKFLESRAPNLIVLGRKDEVMSEDQHLPIISFLIRCGSRFLHYNFVCSLLNDLFGIQSRGGCQCSGPYSQRLLGLTRIVPDVALLPGGQGRRQASNAVNNEIEQAMLDKAEVLRPGYSRLSLNYTMSPACVDYILRALEFVSKYGWRFMLYYRCSERTGEWRHHSRVGKPLGKDRLWLSNFDVERGNRNGMEDGENSASKGEGDYPSNEDEVQIFAETFASAESLLNDIVKKDRSMIEKTLSMSSEDGLNSAYEHLRWFVYPREVAKMLSDEGSSSPPSSLCCPISAYIVGGIQPIDSDDRISVVESEPVVVVPVFEEEKKYESPLISDLFSFREGEGHEGQATFDEIYEGFEVLGELTAKCIVYSGDAWLQIGEFIDQQNEYKRERERQEVVQEVVQEEQEEEEEEVVVVKKEVVTVTSEKKPSRKADNWSTETTPSIPTPPTLPIPASALTKTPPSPPSPPSPPPSTSSFADKVQPGKTLTIPACIQSNFKLKPIVPPKKLLKKMSEAIMQWQMIKDGDKLLLGLSGGKDSLTLLHCLLDLQKRVQVKFTIACATVDPMTPSFDPSAMIPYMQSLGVEYHYIKTPIVERANTSGKDGAVVDSLCAFCARMKRGALYSCARDNGCTKLVLAQHLDDLAESFLMSAIHNGFLRTMKANYEVDVGGLRVIRPLAYCRETMMKEFALAANLPVINENCPACFEEPKERARIKKLLSKEENLFPQLYDNLRRAMLPLMDDDMNGICKSYTEEIIDRGRKVGQKTAVRKDVEGGMSLKDSIKKAVEKNNSNNSSSVNGDNNGTDNNNTTNNSDKAKTNTRLSTTTNKKLLVEASDDDLVAEMARRKVAKIAAAAKAESWAAGKGNGGMKCGVDGTCEMFE